MAEKFFWADQIAEEIIEKKGNKKEYVCASGITPSGTIHIGNFREVITTELVVRALEDKGKKVRFIYSWDDYDRFRKVPKNVPEEYEKYVGMPLSEIPSHIDSEKSYAEYFEEEFENSLKKVGIKPEFINQNKMNRECKYSSLIKTSIDKRKEIMSILNKHRKEPLKNDWYPVTVYCENCYKDSTKITKSEGHTIEYFCKCGHAGKIDYTKKGLVKLKWRVDWPARWKYEGVSFEPGGIDHSAAGGSFDTSKIIVKDIFNFEAPIYTFYEWVRLKGGKEFSSSSGNATSLDDVEEVYEPEILRYIFVGTRPNKGFHISFDNEIIKIYEEYDDLERRYFEGLLNDQEKRIYELSQVGKVRKKKPERIGFRHLITLVQIGKTNELKNHDKIRAEKVTNWLNKYAEDDMRFSIQEKIHPDVSLGDNEKKALKELGNRLKIKDWEEDQLFEEFYSVCEEFELKNKDFFKAAYNVILNRNGGPRLASLILAVGKDQIAELFEKIK